MIWRLNKKIVVIFILALFLMSGIGAVSIWTTNRLIESARWVSHTQEVIGRLESILSDLKDMETAVRGYVIVTDAVYLQPYWTGLNRLEKDTLELRQLVSDNLLQQRKLDELVLKITERTANLQDVLDAHRKKGFAESQKLIRTNRGLEIMDHIRVQIQQMEARERSLLAQRQRQEEETVAHTKTILITGATTAFVLLAGVFWLLQRETVQRLQSQKENHAYLERIRDLYDTAPCGYHSLDKKGIYLELNETECLWLGYQRDEIVGRLSFRDILTEQSRNLFDKTFPIFICEGQVRELEMEIRHLDGTLRTVLISATAVFNSTKEYLSSRSTMFDITERKAAESRIVELNAATERNSIQLQAANNELEAFSYTVSHDLRAPLRHLDGFVQLLQKRNSEALDERGKRYLTIISEAARQMGHLIDDLLVFAKMGRSDMVVTEVDFNVMVRSIIESLASEYALREIDWKIHRLPLVKGDPAMLRVVWTNLVANSIKYTRPRGLARIEIGWELRGVDACFFIRDNGVGFDMEHAGKLFGVFQRLHRSEDFEGTGIGLASVRRIIHRHGGKTMAEGTVGQGAVVYFLLPETHSN